MPHRQTLTAATLAAAMALASPASAEDSITMEAGLWSFENTMSGSADMGGGQTFALPAQTFTSTECITADDATITPERMISEMQEDGADDCQYGDIVFDGLTMTTTITCNAEDMVMTGDYTFTLSDDRRSGTGQMDMSGTADGMAMTSSFTMTGQRQGPCG